MLASEYRLSGQGNFEKVLAGGTFVQANSFGLVYLKRSDELVSRYGFVVSTKVAKEAVLRNRIKRALSEAVRFLVSDVKRGYDVVFLAKQKGLKMSTDEIMREVRGALLKAGLMQ